MDVIDRYFEERKRFLSPITGNAFEFAINPQTPVAEVKEATVDRLHPLARYVGDEGEFPRWVSPGGRVYENVRSR